MHPICYCIVSTAENARAGGEFKGLILACLVWCEISAVGLHFCDTRYSLQSPKQVMQNLFIL